MTVDWTRAFPASLGPSVRAVEARLPPVDLEYDGFAHETNNGRWTAPTVWGEVVMIPQRIYNPSPPTGLSPSPSLEALLLACVYSRHHNGYVRQAAARGLLECDEPFVAPFLVQLLGEYVVEIVVDIADRIEATDQLPTGLVEFVRENPDFTELTTARAHSYWSAYHRRRYVDSQDYPALRALSLLQ